MEIIITGKTIGLSGGSYTIEEIARLFSKHCAPAVIKDGKVSLKTELYSTAASDCKNEIYNCKLMLQTLVNKNIF